MSRPAPSLRVLLGSAMGLRLAMAALNFALFWLLSHRLDTAGLGGFSVLMNLFLMVQFLPMLGLSALLIRRAATERGQVALEMSNALAMALPVAAVIAVGVALVGHFNYPPEMEMPFLLLALCVLPGAWTLVAESTLLGLERMVDIARVQCTEVAARVVLSVAAVEAGLGLTGVFAVLLLGRLAVAGVYLRLRDLPRPSWRLVHLDALHRNLAEVPTFFGISLLAVLSARLDVQVLSHTQGLEAVGVYSAAARLYDAALMLPTVAALTLMPTLARLFSESPDQFKALLGRAVRVTLALGGLGALAVASLSPWIIAWLYKPAMGAAAPVLAWLIFGAMLTTVDQVLSSTMLAARAQRQDIRVLAIAVLVLLGALLWGTHSMGPLGAAVALVLAHSTRVILRLRWAMRTLALPGLGRQAALPLGVTLAAAAGMWAVRSLGPLAAWATAWSLWFLLAGASGLVGRQEWRQIQHQGRQVWHRLRLRSGAGA